MVWGQEETKNSSLQNYILKQTIALYNLLIFYLS